MIVYIITRSFPPFHKTGSSFARLSMVNGIKKLGYNVKVIVPASNLGFTNRSDLIPIRTNFFPPLKLLSKLERFGLITDYLNIWANQAFSLLKNKIKITYDKIELMEEPLN